MSTAEVIKSVGLTVLVLAAFVIGLLAGLSALRKWRAAETAQTAAARESLIRQEVKAEYEQRVAAAFARKADDTTVFPREGRWLEDRLRQYGYSPTPKANDGASPASGAAARQTPAEAWWGIIALGCATAAGIWDAWG
ncbi:hypothetical protein [Frigoribacterium sp. PhB107]|uniref:hypothetical protein n=1 Tax=Frigoribacterium sp. PhB107 TaxID=2485172 RepID=UPI0011CE0C8C|nr:hypothetical protein [Frigoribacterium sp. PhB107]